MINIEQVIRYSYISQLFCRIMYQFSFWSNQTNISLLYNSKFPFEAHNNMLKFVSFKVERNGINFVWVFSSHQFIIAHSDYSMQWTIQFSENHSSNAIKTWLTFEKSREKNCYIELKNCVTVELIRNVCRLDWAERNWTGGTQKKCSLVSLNVTGGRFVFTSCW